MPPRKKAGASSQFDASEVMQPVQALRGRMDAAGSSRKRTLEEVGVSGVSKEVQHMGGRLIFFSENFVWCTSSVVRATRGNFLLFSAQGLVLSRSREPGSRSAAGPGIDVA